MLPIQTEQILLGMAVAVLYGGAVLATGILLVIAIVPHPARTAIRAQGGRTSLVWLGFVLAQGCLGVGWLALSLAGLLYAQIVWSFCAVGWMLGTGMLWVWRRAWTETVQQIWTGLWSRMHRRSWYLWLGDMGRSARGPQRDHGPFTTECGGCLYGSTCRRPKPLRLVIR